MASGATMCAPGASTSGLAAPSWVTPRLENAAVTSSPGSGVPSSSVAPTEITYGSLPGGYWTASAAVAAVARGDDDDDPGVPGELDGRVERVVDGRTPGVSELIERLTTRMLRSSLWSTTNCSAVMTSTIVASPASSATLSAIRSASGAMPT